jgi:glucosamine--fructose-6-phosphate aminotransferase (isomerizing)
MCGIFAYTGPRKAVQVCLSGLRNLEYRGYDSAGVAGLDSQGQLVLCKQVGKVADLEAKLEEQQISFNVGIAHTRWATHGKPNVINAHPHTDTHRTLALVHNGIIENHDVLREKLKAQGVTFVSDTDSEVVAQLIASLYHGDVLMAIQQAVSMLTGTYSIAVIHRDAPGKIYATANACPLAIGIGSSEVFLSSDTSAFLTQTREVIYLADSEVAVISDQEIQCYDATMELVKKKREILDHQIEDASKGKYAHFTLKEIFEQPQTIKNALLSRYLEESGNAVLDGLNFSVEELLDIKRVLILACGTSWHAGYVAAYMLEDRARIPTQVEISSEFRYKNPIVPEGTFVIAISQSGETADTIAAMRELKAKGARVMAICNVQGSTLARESDGCLFLRAGPEIGVCSTKAFTSQLVVLSLFTVMMARMRHMSKAEGQAFIAALKTLPDVVQQVLNQEEAIIKIARKYAHYDHFFFLGRRYMFPASLEGALKLKEISYINANGYPAGELKHGPIALINEDCPTVALCANKMTFDKMLSNLREVKARSGPVIAIVEEGVSGEIDQVSDDIIRIPSVIDELAAIPTTVVTQLLSYYIAKERGAEIDRPRNLAKSVTVE